MKSSISLSMLLLTMSIIAQPVFADSEAERCGRPSLCKEKKKEHCKSFINITEHDINKASRHSTLGLVLDRPGTYKLCEDVNWTVKTPNSFAITITATNVSLDLDGHFIKQIDTTQAGNFAINITGQTENTLVHNGVLQQISGGAILVDAGASCITIDHMACNRCSYNGATAITPPIPAVQSWAAAILLNGSTDAPIDHATITNCTFCDTGILGTAPVWFTGTISGGTTLTLAEDPLYPINPGFVLSGAGIVGSPTIVSGTGMSYIISSAQPDIGPEPMTATDPNGAFIPLGSISAILADFSSYLTVRDCMVDGCFGELFAFGMTFAVCSSLVLSNISINNPSTFILAKGIEFLRCNDALIEDVNISNVLMNFTPLVNTFPAGHGAEGIKCGSSTDCIFRRVSFRGNRIQTQVPTAFTAPSSYADCCGLFYDVISGAGPLHNIVVEDCTVIDMVNDGGKAFGNTAYTAGFNNSSAVILGTIVEEMNTLQYVNCSASGLRAELGWAYGFGSSPQPNFVAIENDMSFVGCSAEDIVISGSGIYAAGFILTASRDQVINSSANRILDKREFQPTGPAAYGVILDNLTGIHGVQEANSCVISGNRLTNCDTLGIFDNTTLQINIVTGNYAALNGTNGAGPSYDIRPNAPIVVWHYLTDPLPAPATPSSLNNLDIQNN